MSSDLNEIVDMLESKLAEKEKEIEELKRMNEIELSQIKAELREEITAKIVAEVNSKLEELKAGMKAEIRSEIKSELADRIVEELASRLREEILSLKRGADAGRVLEQRVTTLEAKVIELTKAVDSLTKEFLYLKSDKLPVKPSQSSQSRERVKQQLKNSKTAKLVEEKDDDIIVCD